MLHCMNCFGQAHPIKKYPNRYKQLNICAYTPIGEYYEFHETCWESWRQKDCSNF